MRNWVKVETAYKNPNRHSERSEESLFYSIFKRRRSFGLQPLDDKER